MILEIISPEVTLFSGTITSVTLPGVDGNFQILNHHAPIVSILRDGVVKISAENFDFSPEAFVKFTKIDEKSYAIAINSGTIEMNDNKVIVLVD